MAPRGRTKKLSDDRLSLAYTRVSSERQSSNGVSLDAQEERIRARCVADGRKLSEIIKDGGESAGSLKRPGLRRIVEGVKAGEIEAVYVFKLDRLTRQLDDLRDLLKLFDKHKVALVSLSEALDTQSAGGRLVVNILGLVAEWEREAAGERTAEALRHLRRQGRAYSRVTPFGWRRHGNRLVVHPSEKRALTMAKTMRAKGYSLRQIGKALTGRGVKPRGRSWYAASVAAVLGSKMATERAA